MVDRVSGLLCRYQRVSRRLPSVSVRERSIHDRPHLRAPLGSQPPYVHFVLALGVPAGKLGLTLTGFRAALGPVLTFDMHFAVPRDRPLLRLLDLLFPTGFLRRTVRGQCDSIVYVFTAQRGFGALQATAPLTYSDRIEKASCCCSSSSLLGSWRNSDEDRSCSVGASSWRYVFSSWVVLVSRRACQVPH